MSESIGTSKISNCGQYRYYLTRPSEALDPQYPAALFIMLNPSTADASVDDPTIRRCRGFAKTWGCYGITVANLYALRSTNPKKLWTHKDPVGAENDNYLKSIIRAHKHVICAWGANAKQERVNSFAQMIKDTHATAWCLGTTKSGAPRHPLYVRADQPLIPYEFKLLDALSS